jgi:hypothetical protein
MPGPPALVKIVNFEVNFDPWERGSFANTYDISNKSEILLTCNIPQQRKAASKTASLPANAPV